MSRKRQNSNAIVLNRPTKQSRREERQKVGPLSRLVIQPKTHTRYRDSYQKFCEFHQFSPHAKLTDLQGIDELAAEFIEFLWEQGSPKSEAS